MLHFRLTISHELRQALQRKLDIAQRQGDLPLVKWVLALFAVARSQDLPEAAAVLQLSVAQVERYVYQFMVYGLPGVAFQKSSRAPAEIDGDAKGRTQTPLGGRAAGVRF